MKHIMTNSQELKKKRIEVQNEPENVPIDLYLHEDEGGLPTTLALEGNEKVNLEPQGTIAERIKLNLQKKKATGTRLKLLTPSKFLTRLPILLASIKAENDSHKLKNEIR